MGGTEAAKHAMLDAMVWRLGRRRDFLNSVTTDIIHLHDNKLHQYKGNFAQFEGMYDQRRREVRPARALGLGPCARQAGGGGRRLAARRCRRGGALGARRRTLGPQACVTQRDPILD